MKTSIPVNLTEKLLCPYCSGELSYRISRREVACSLCGMKLSPEEYEAAAAAKRARQERSSSSLSSSSFSSASSPSSSASSSAPAANPKAGEANNRSAAAPDYVSCEHCRLLLGRGIAALLGECPLCDRTIPGAENSAGRKPAENASFAAPDLIVPFAKEKEFFIQKFRKHLKALEFAPDAMLAAGIESVRAFYVPVILYDAEVSGEMTFHAEVLTEILTNKYGTKYKLQEFEIEAAGSQLYSGSPENLALGIGDDVLRNLEPFDSKEARPWSRVYAAMPDLTVPVVAGADYFELSRQRFKGAFEYFLAKGELFNSFSVTKEKVSVIPLKVSYAWLPVWVMKMNLGGTEALCYMNGQTGKIEADIPVAQGKILGWLFSGLLLLTGVTAWFAAPIWMPVTNIPENFCLGVVCMIFLMMIYSVIAPVRWLFSGRLSWRITGSLFAGAGTAFAIAAFFSAPEYCWSTLLFMPAMLVGGSLVIGYRWNGIKRRMARKLSQDPRKEGSVYAAKSSMRYRRSRQISESYVYRCRESVVSCAE